MTDEMFTTFLIEVERILNGRPITKVAADSRDVEALTPNVLLKGYLEASLPMGEFTKADGYRKSWRLVGLLSDQFWSRWQKEYLPLLQQRQKWLCPERNLSVNDLVLIIGEQSRRGQWPKELLKRLILALMWWCALFVYELKALQASETYENYAFWKARTKLIRIQIRWTTYVILLFN